MHAIEPHYSWRHLYMAEEDEHSPFFNREYSEIYFTNSIYEYLIHPQWDEIGSSTLYVKLLYTDYEEGFAIIEMIGEWNDCIGNDVMFFKREVIDPLISSGINKFILVGENVLNFHFDGDDYYEEWFQDVEEGWIAAVNFQQHVLQEFRQGNIDYYFNFGGDLDHLPWRTYEPATFFERVEGVLRKRLV